jgi:hypothetical protein
MLYLEQGANQIAHPSAIGANEREGFNLGVQSTHNRLTRQGYSNREMRGLGSRSG